MVGVVAVGGFGGALIAFDVEEQCRGGRKRLRFRRGRCGLLRGGACEGEAEEKGEAAILEAGGEGDG